MNKIALVSGMLAIVTAAHADCASTVNGFYVGIQAGIKVINVKDKITTAKYKIEGKKSYHKLSGSESGGGVSQYLLELGKEAYKGLSNEDADDISEKVWLAHIDLQNALANGNLILKREDLTDEDNGVMWDWYETKLKKLDEMLEKAGMKVMTDKGKQYKFGAKDQLIIYNQNIEDDNTLVFALDIPDSTTKLKVVQISGGKEIYEIPLQKLTASHANTLERSRGLMLLTVPFPEAGGDEPNGGMYYKGLQDFMKLTFHGIVRGMYGDDINKTIKEMLVKTTSAEVYSKEIDASEIEIHSNKNQLTLGLGVGYQHAFGVFYTGVELDAEFTPGKVKVQKFDLAKSKEHYLAGSLFNYDTEVAAARPEITLKTKYSFGITPMFGITSGNWMFYIPVTLKFTKYDINVTPSSTFEDLKVPTVTYSEDSTKADRFGPYTLIDPTVTAVDAAAATTTTETDSAENDTKTVSTYKKGKTKFGIEFGLGARVMLSQNFFIGLRYMYSPKTSIKIDTPAYTTNALHDVYKNGASHKFSVTSHKGVLEIGYKF